ncbi:MltR family transcriptional regulator [Vibrio alginolyticus]|uniref:MltR family transcriptional regulator n=1 Tax=Vibrio alginolyticus TaxID=663 RepID=UPI000303B716|nr:MltR family transcriptional regulator [Vibrio alginolyticus]EGR0144549.1 transcriptional regulator [Vibrio alginolyticus]EGR0167628.1 transcriptional regulator [Vibrio alginolyticus]EHI5140089.1 transcriptional regulator [Vibrio alginolyticus]EJL6749668.1 transcriptional regulator [Vibrio alginolyticus]EJL6853404.1 transcriptional regulator [Vibrio alginolyticus]
MSLYALAKRKPQETIHLPNESELVEVIAEADDPSSVIVAAYHALDDAIGAVMQRMLSRNEQAVQYIVDPLMGSAGPLGDIKVRAGLLLGLGVVSREVYADLEVFLRLKEYCEDASKPVSFTDLYVLTELRSIEAIKRTMPIEYDPSMISGLSEMMMKMFIERHNQKVRSTIVLAITDLVSQLSGDVTQPI